jgi:hypothetical protein
MLGAQALEGDPLASQPPSEVLGHLDAASNPRPRIAVRLQVGPEAPENYVKVAGKPPALDRADRDLFPAHGGIRKALNFHRFRHPSPYLLLPANTNPNSSRGRSAWRNFP